MFKRTNLEPVGDNILLEFIDQSTKDGLILPDKLKKFKILILAVAEGSKYKVGQEVILDREALEGGKISGMKRDGKEFFIAKEHYITCIVK